MIWIIYFIKLIIADENPLVGRMVNIDLSEVEYPAITICSEQTTKNAFAERLGNYFDPDEGLPDLLNKLKKKFLDTVLKKYEYVKYKSFCMESNIRYGSQPESCKVITILI